LASPDEGLSSISIYIYIYIYLQYWNNIIIGLQRKLHNEELHNLYSSPNINIMTTSRRMRATGHVARIGRSGMHIVFWWEATRILGVGGRIILRWLCEK
jgi:hypothetical protein